MNTFCYGAILKDASGSVEESGLRLTLMRINFILKFDPVALSHIFNPKRRIRLVIQGDGR